MSPTLRNWLIGLLGSWAVLWALGPLLFDSILVRSFDDDLQTVTLHPGMTVRWTSEGWGLTRIGSNGLAGCEPLTILPGEDVIVLWGDSQVEGFCVPDDRKLVAQAEGLARPSGSAGVAYQSGRATRFLSLGRSGTDAKDWSRLMPAVQRKWDAKWHVWVITQWSDLQALADFEQPIEESSSRKPSPPWVRNLAAVRAETLVRAARRTFLVSQTGQWRRLQFGMGPRQVSHHGDHDVPETSVEGVEGVAGTLIGRLRELTDEVDSKLLMVYAPAVPRILGGYSDLDRDDESFAAFSRNLDLAADERLALVDAREAFIDLWTSQRMLARGFHNGLPGYGHLNEHGNRVLAQLIVNVLSGVQLRSIDPER